jgi:hypothetical protein
MLASENIFVKRTLTLTSMLGSSKSPNPKFEKDDLKKELFKARSYALINLDGSSAIHILMSSNISCVVGPFKLKLKTEKD